MRKVIGESFIIVVQNDRIEEEICPQFVLIKPEWNNNVRYKYNL